MALIVDADAGDRIWLDLVPAPVSDTTFDLVPLTYSHWSLRWSYNQGQEQGSLSVGTNRLGVLTHDPLGALLRGELTKY